MSWRALLLLLALLGLGAAPLPRRVVVISLDGLRAAQDLSGLPTLQRLQREGAWSAGVEPVVPSTTYPNHATLVTGVRPLRHGISGNASPTRPGDWHFYAEELRATPLWRPVRERGGRVAALSWPVTVGADIDLLVPEYVRFGLPHDAPLLNALCRPPGLLQRLAPVVPDRRDGLDDFLTDAALQLLRQERPDLTLLHLVDLDHVQHEFGPDSPQARDTLQREDARLARLLEVEATVVLVSDHGFTRISEDLSVPVLLEQTGFAQHFTPQPEGGYCGLYWRHAPDEAVLQRALDTLPGALTRQELDRLGAFPDAALALKAEGDRVFSSRTQGPLEAPSRRRGAHGFDPTRPDQHAVFVAWGPGIRPARLPRMRMEDVAPTVARLLGVELPEAEGRAADL